MYYGFAKAGEHLIAVIIALPLKIKYGKMSIKSNDTYVKQWKQDDHTCIMFGVERGKKPKIVLGLGVSISIFRWRW